MSRHTFVNHIVAMLEDVDRWNSNAEVTKDEMAREVRTSLLRCMRAGLVHPFTTFYSLEASTVLEAAAAEPQEPQAIERGEM